MTGNVVCFIIDSDNACETYTEEIIICKICSVLYESKMIKRKEWFIENVEKVLLHLSESSELEVKTKNNS